MSQVRLLLGLCGAALALSASGCDTIRAVGARGAAELDPATLRASLHRDPRWVAERAALVPAW